jgi:hypothetical protein
LETHIFLLGKARCFAVQIDYIFPLIKMQFETEMEEKNVAFGRIFDILKKKQRSMPYGDPAY